MAIIVHLLDLHVNDSTPVGACSIHAWSTELGRGCQPDCAVYSTTFVRLGHSAGAAQPVGFPYGIELLCRCGCSCNPPGSITSSCSFNTSTHKVEHYQREPDSGKGLTKAEATRLAEKFNQNGSIRA
jgi:hypothetical protein